MTDKKLKYKALLETFPNCPSDDFQEVDIKAFRWTKEPVTSKDFVPINILNEPPQRLLDDSDKMCLAYGLSFFDSMENAYSKYIIEYKKRRQHQRLQFLEDRGTFISTIILSTSDGIADIPNNANYGHFTFHQYEGVNLEELVKNTQQIFREDGTINL